MNRANPNGASGAISDESDDLIAELARIVARDAHATRQDIKTEPPRMAPPMPAALAPRPKAQPATTDPDEILIEGFRTIAEPKLQAPAPQQIPSAMGTVRPLRPADLGLIAEAPMQTRPAAFAPAEFMDFDFLGTAARQLATEVPKPAPAVEAPVASYAAPSPDYDPIAELIAQSEAALAEEIEFSPATRAAKGSPPTVDEAPSAAAADRFETPPGLRDARIERVMPSSGSNDPLDEIERLIAETTSIDFPAPPPLPRAAPSQAVRAEMAAKPAAADEPLRARPHLDDAAEAAEAAIRASVTASTATVEAADRPGARAAAFAMTIGLGRFIVPATAALVVLVLAGGGAYWYFTQVGEPPVVTAQTASVKEPAPAIDAANDSIVFSQLGDSAAQTPDTEQIVSRDETAGESGEDLARVITPESDTGGLANRKVRTVTVRADGTIVSGDEATAGVEPLPALRPNVPDVPGAPAIEDGDADAIGDVLNALAEEEQAPGETTAPVDPQASALLATDEPVATGVGNVAPIPIPRPNNLAAPTTTTQPATQPAATPIPQPVPTGQPVNIAVIEPAPVADVSGEPVPLMAGANPAVPTQTASLTATPIASASSAPYYVQLSSQRSETAARSTVDEIRRLYGNIIGSTRLEIQLVDLGDRGVFYRVKAPAASAAAATALCNQIKVAGGDCFVRAD